MPELNLHNIDQITRDVRMQEIGFSHLFHDLVDHICCDVEFQMQHGLSFEEAYRSVRGKIGSGGLKNIQEETLYAVDTKYRNMKKLMKISSVAGTIMLGFAAIFKISHLPLAGILLCAGAFILSFLFLPSALVVLWKETKNRKKLILFISAFITGVAFIVGMLFKIQHWPGAGAVISFSVLTGTFLFLPSLFVQLFRDQEKKRKRFLYVTGGVSIMIYVVGFWCRIQHWPFATFFITIGTLVLIFIVFPWFTHLQWKNETNVNARFIFMVIAPLLIIMPGAMVNLNLERVYENGFYIRLKKQDALIKLQEEANNKLLALYLNSVSYDQIAGIHSATNELISVINLVEQNLAAVAEGDYKKRDQTLLELKDSDYFDPANDRFPINPFTGKDADLMLLPGSKARDTVEKELGKYKQILIKQLGNDWTIKYDTFLNASDYMPGSNTSGSDLLLLPNLNSLSLLKSGILITESAALKQITSEQ